MTILNIENLEVNTTVGKANWEKQIQKKIIVNISIKDFNSSLMDYTEICEKITLFSNSHTCDLLANFMDNLAKFLQKSFSIQEMLISITDTLAISNAKSITISNKYSII